MIASLKSELRKIWTVRSTYMILLFSLAMIAFFAFYNEGMRATTNSSAPDYSFKLAALIRDAVSTLAVFGALVGILSLTHEYRYNTISYTLTSSRSRSISLLTKILAVSIFSIFFTALVAVLAIGGMHLGLAVKGYTLGPQVISVSILWQALFLGWGFSMLGLLIATLMRQQVGAIAAYFLIPVLGENLLGLILKDNRIYLPFTALGQVIKIYAREVPGKEELLKADISAGKAVFIVGTYLVVGWTIAWILFLRRDAN